MKQRVKTAEKKAEFFQREQLLVEEQARQRGELLENAVQESKVARKENRILMAKIASLQAGVETFSDEQVKQEMCLLYHDLEHWRFTHFVAKPKLQQRNDPTARSDGLDISTLDIIQAHIAGLIYRSFWNGFMVGSDQCLCNYLRKADSEINKQCKWSEKP
jgi:hypothetical protein